MTTTRCRFLYGSYGDSGVYQMGRECVTSTLGSLRLLGTVGEPINPEAWMWYYREIGKEAPPDCGYVVADGDGRAHDCADPGSCG